MLNFEPHKPTYKISIEVGRSFIARIQPTIIRLTLRRSAMINILCNHSMLLQMHLPHYLHDQLSVQLLSDECRQLVAE